MKNTSNAFALKPALPEPFPDVPEFWECPITGLKVPKDVNRNLQWRSELLEQAAKDSGLQRDLYTASSLSILFWINTFAYTFRVFEADAKEVGRLQQATEADLPYVTWTIQDKHLLAIEKAIDGATSLLTDKTREMGATWNHVAVFHHQLIFRPNRLFLEMSRVETDVDGSDNPRCLFVKHDYINKWLPSWMAPPIKRTNMHIINISNGSRIDGESSNKAAGSSARVHAILLDEFAKMENGAKIKSSVRDVAPCILPNSTPFGPGTAYSKWRMSGQVEVFDLPWWEHPEKGQGRYLKQDETTGKWEIRSPWFDHEETIRDPKEMAQEINRDHIGSGDTYFEAHVIEEHKRMFACKPLHCRSFDFKKDVPVGDMARIIARCERDRVAVSGNGHWRLWCQLTKGRPDQSKNYVIGCDISKGMGASNSAASVLCAESREKVAEYTNSTVPPHEFARVICAAALWFGGARKNGRPLIIWEANGDPGVNFGRELIKVLGYPFYWFDRAGDTVAEKRSKRYGWHSNARKKASALGLYRQALSTGGIINHSEEALLEALTYVHYPNGNIGPAEWLDEKANHRQNHGDRVIADMLTLVAITDSPKARKQVSRPPTGSIGHRMNQWKRAKKQALQQKRFDFRRGMSYA